MNRSDTIDGALRLLDRADRTVDPTSSRARADLDTILATEPGRATGPRLASSPIADVRAPQLSRPVRRAALLGGVAVAAAASIVVMPALTGGDQAFATWKATPQGMSAQERERAADACRESQAGGPGSAYVDLLDRSETVVAERRGAWSTVMLADVGGFSALCITDDSSHLFDKAWIGSVGAPTAYAAPGPRDLSARDLGVGTMSSGDISLAAGDAGTEVSSVAYDSRSHGRVVATVTGGHFALWFPGDELLGASSDGVDVQVTYTDGTTDTVRLTL
ncbi:MULTISPECIES: hypothetical protein [unclassified Isoptericola]|uniref:hypothetical protein n=1 Tax=Isoptericola sp. NPDC057191 TaxID=3346041 RepID=UPI00363F56F8